MAKFTEKLLEKGENPFVKKKVAVKKNRKAIVLIERENYKYMNLNIFPLGIFSFD